MQLILKPETTVDINTKMSLNEENIEECVSSVLSVAKNGDMPNGEITNETKEAGDGTKNDDIKQVKETEITNADCEVEKDKTDANSIEAKIDHSPEVGNETDKTTDIANGKDTDRNEEPSQESNSVEQRILSIAEGKEDVVEKITEKNEAAFECLQETSKTPCLEKELDDNLINTESGLTDGSSLEGEGKSVTTGEDKEDTVCSNTYTELLDDTSIENHGTADATSPPTLCSNTYTELLDDTSIENHGTADATSLPVTKEDDSTVSINTEKEVNDDNITVVGNGDDCIKKTQNETVNLEQVLNYEQSPDSTDTIENVTVAENHPDTVNKTTDTKLNDDNCVDNTIDERKAVEVDELKKTVDITNEKLLNDSSSSLDASETVHEEEIKMKDDNTTNVSKSSGDSPDGVKNEIKKDICIEDTSTAQKEGNNKDVSNEESNHIHTTTNVKEAERDTPEVDASMENEESIINDSKQTLGINEHENKIEEKRADTNTIKDKRVEDMEVDDNSDNIAEGVKPGKGLDCSPVKSPQSVDISEQNASGKQIEDMEVDDPSENVKEKVMPGMDVEPSPAKSPQIVDISEHNASFNIEPISSENSDALIPISSDDVILDIDDDKTTESADNKESESTELVEDCDQRVINDEDKELSKKANTTTAELSSSPDEIIDLDENVNKDVETTKHNEENKKLQENLLEKSPEEPKTIPPVLKLSNTLDILSDDEDGPKESNVADKCINIEDDDDIMLIDEDTSGTENKNELGNKTDDEKHEEPTPVENAEESQCEESEIDTPVADKELPIAEKEEEESTLAPEKSDRVEETKTDKEFKKPLIHEKFLKTCKKNLSVMTKEELEEFCILKIVESVLDRSNLSEIKIKLKTLTQNIDEYKKKAMMLTKQNRDLQVVLKSIQEDQKKGVNSIVPLKITRSVGMQVMMADKNVQQRRKSVAPPPNNVANKPIRSPVIQSPRPQKPSTPQIPVPRLVPANNPTLKTPGTPPANTGKTASPQPNGIRNVSPIQKAEKRTHNRIHLTVDLTDDEPPTKVVNRTQGPVVPPVRLVPSQNLLANPRAPAPTVNSPRKVYIPISGPQGQNIRPGQTIMLKTAGPNANPRQRIPPPQMMRMPSAMRMTRPHAMRHPAPLPDCMKQYQPPNWKALPPAPDLKLAKVENGIVISWKIEGYQEDSYEEIASYQLYAYQETSSPPNTALWKKIGDVKALPLPMACTLTQFMAGYKYYFAVRAVDIRSRLGPFSLPGSILLLNKS